MTFYLTNWLVDYNLKIYPHHPTLKKNFFDPYDNFFFTC